MNNNTLAELVIMVPTGYSLVKYASGRWNIRDKWGSPILREEDQSLDLETSLKAALAQDWRVK